MIRAARHRSTRTLRTVRGQVIFIMQQAELQVAIVCKFNKVIAGSIDPLRVLSQKQDMCIEVTAKHHCSWLHVAVVVLLAKCSKMLEDIKLRDVR